jgi:hypothetical protein
MFLVTRNESRSVSEPRRSSIHDEIPGAQWLPGGFRVAVGELCRRQPLVLAVREDDTWRYIGHVGTGFSHKILEELHGKLMKLKVVAKSPFGGKVKAELETT